MLKYCQKCSIYSYQSIAVIFVRQLGIPFLRYQLPVCFLGVPRDYNNYFMVSSVEESLWERQVWTEESGFHSLRRNFLSSQSPVWLWGPPNLSEVLPTSCPLCTWGPHFARAKQPGHEAHHSSSCSAELENARSSTSSFHTCYNMVLN